MYSIREFGYQCILYMLDEVLRYGDVLNILQADEKDRIVERKDVPLFENDAFREAVINAFVHNKWVTENEPMITVFSDRIEILSRGILPPEQTLEGFFRGESFPCFCSFLILSRYSRLLDFAELIFCETFNISPHYVKLCKNP